MRQKQLKSHSLSLCLYVCVINIAFKTLVLLQLRAVVAVFVRGERSDVIYRPDDNNLHAIYGQLYVRTAAINALAVLRVCHFVT